jgi:carboxyl-terminal processing protease
LLHAIDPEDGEYYTKKDLEYVRGAQRSQTNAFGLSFRRENQRTIVVPLVPSPASVAGLQSGDRIEILEGHDVQSLRLWELRRLLESLPQTTVTLTVRRGDSAKTVVVTADDKLDLTSIVAVEWPTPEIMLLRPPQFVAGTLKESADAIATNWRNHDIHGIILDLRGNPGGLLGSLIGHASMFLRGKSLVATLRSNAAIPNNMRIQASPRFYLLGNGPDPLSSLPAEVKTIPLAVLISASTSSGAELIAAAIQSHKRGTLVGATTSGVASIQTSSLLPNGGAIKYTSAYWEPPSGKRVQGDGIVPDLVVKDIDPRAAVTAAIGVLIPASSSQPKD